MDNDTPEIAALGSLSDVIEAWAFNVMLECAGSADDKLECLMGGAVLDLRDLDRILSAVRAHLASATKET